MAKALNVSLAVTADTSQAKAQLQQLQTTLSQLSTSSTSLHLGLNSSELSKAISDVDKLSVHLKNATNSNGLLDFGKLNTSIKQSGSSLTAYGNQLLKLGPQGQQAFNQLTQAIAKSEIPVSRIKGLLGEFGTVLGNTIRWQAASSAIHGMMGSIQHAFSYAQQLNKSLNNIQIVTQQSDTQMAKFAETANKAAKRLSTTTTEYTNASLIYYQQGLSDKEVQARTETTIKMANASGQSAQAVSDQMTAIWNNFAKGSSNLEYYADVITALGAATASSSAEIATGLEKFASVANTVGLSYENATAALATITATTRQSADTVGTGLRTLFSRLQSLSLGETLEDGVNLTKYSKALKTVGVEVLDATGNLRRMDDILLDLGDKWDTLSQAQQTALAQTVGGVRQYTTLVALMENIDFYKENLKIAANAEGTVQAQTDIYAKSWEAAQKRVKASAESIYSNLISDDFFIGLNNGFASFLDILDQIIDGFGGLKTLIPMIGAALTNLFSSQISTGMVNFANGLAMFKPGYAKQQASERNAFLQNASQQMIGVTPGTMMTASQKQQAEWARADLSIQQNYARNAGAMTAFDKQLAQMSMDKFTNLRLQQIEAQNKAAASQFKVTEARGTLAGVNTSKMNSFANYRDLDRQTQAGYYNALNYQTLARQGQLPSNQQYFGNTSSQANLWYHQNGDFSRQVYTNALANSGDIDELSRLVNREASLRQIFGNLKQTGAQGLTAAGRDLAHAGFSRDEISNFMSQIYNRGTKQLMMGNIDSIISNSSQNQAAMVDEFATKWNMAKEAVQGYADAIVAANGDSQKEKELVEQIKQARSEAEQNTKANKQLQTAQQFTKYAMAMQSAVAVGNSLAAVTQNIVTNLENGGSVFDNFGQTLSGVTSGVMSFAMIMTAIPGPVGIAIGVISALIGVLSQIPAVQDWFSNLFKSDTEIEINKLQKLSDSLHESFDEAKEKANNFLAATGAHNQLLEEINKLTKGTTEFKTAVIEANGYVRSMLGDYNLSLNDLEQDDNGVLTFKPGVVEQKQIELNAQRDNLEAMTTFMDSYYIPQLKTQRAFDHLNEYGYKILDVYDTAVDPAIKRTSDQKSTSHKLMRELIDEYKQQSEYTQFEDYLNARGIETEGRNAALGWQGFQIALNEFGYDSVDDYIEALNLYGPEGLANHSFSEIAGDYFTNLATTAVIGEGKDLSISRDLAQFLGNVDNNYVDYDAISAAGDDIIASMQKAGTLKSFLTEKLGADAIADFNDDQLLSAAKAYFAQAEAAKVFNEAYEKYVKIQQNIEEDVLTYSKTKGKNTKQLSELTQSEQLGFIDLINQQIEEEQALGDNADVLKIQALQHFLNEYKQYQEDISTRLVDILGDDNQDEQQKTAAQNALKSFISGLNIDNKTLNEITNLQTSLKENFGDIFNSKFFYDLFDANGNLDQNLMAAWRQIDLTSKVSALFSMKELTNQMGDNNPLKDYFNNLYDDLYDEIGGKSGIFSEIFNTEDFQQELKKVQKEFRKTGKLSAKDIDDVAKSCEDLATALDSDVLSASAVADAIELYSIGAVGSIDEISNAVWGVLEAVNAFEDGLAKAFKYIDEWDSHLDRSTQDLSDYVSKISKDIFQLLGEGNVGGERLYQQLTGLFGEQYADSMRQFFIDQERGANKDNPQARQDAYDARYGKIDKWVQQAQKEGNNRALWEGLLSGDMDSEMSGSVSRERTTRRYNGSQMEEKTESYLDDSGTVSQNLKEIGFSLGKNGDIELDTQGRTTEQMQAALALAMGVDMDSAGVWLQELAGHSASITQDLKTNDYTAALGKTLEMEEGSEDRALSEMELARTDKTTLDESRARLEARQKELQNTADGQGRVTEESKAELDEVQSQLDLLDQVEQKKEDIAKDEETVAAAAGKTTGIYEQLTNTSREHSNDVIKNNQKQVKSFDANGNAIEKEITNVQSLMDYYQSLGMTQEQAWEATKDAYQKYKEQNPNAELGEMGLAAEDAYGNLIGVALDAEASVEDVNAAQKQLAIDMKHSENQELGKDLFKGMVQAATEMSDELQNIEGIDATVDVTVNVKADEAKADIEKLSEGKDVDINVSDKGTVQSTQEAINGLKSSGVTAEVTADTSKAEATIAALETMHPHVTVDVSINPVATGAIITAAKNMARASYNSQASGGLIHSYDMSSANRTAAPGLSLTAEEGPEVVWNKNDGYAYLVGGNGHPEFVVLRPGDRVFNANETRKILNYERPDSNYFNSILQPQNLDQRLFGSFAEGSAYGSYGPNSTYGKTGSGGGDNGKTKDFTPERYHVIKRQIQDLEFWYQELEKARENAYGTNVLEAIDAEIKATDELLKAQKTLVDEAEQFKNEDLKKLQNLSKKYDFKLELDENGNITNWDDLQEKYASAAQNKDETAKEIWDAIKQYEESIDEWQADFSKMTDLQLQKAELQLERITEKREIKIDFDEREIKLLDHYIKHIDDNIYHTAEVLALTEEKLGHINQKIKDTNEGINNVFAELSDSHGNKIINPNTNKAYTLDEWLALSNKERDLLDINGNFGKQLEEYMDDILAYIEELEEFKTKGVKEFGEAFSELNDNVRSSIDLFDHYNSLLSSLKNITDLQGVKLSAEMRTAMKEIDEAMFGNTQNNIDAERENYRRLNSQVAELRQKVADTQDETLKREWEKQLKTAEEELKTSEQNMLQLWETGLQQAKDMFESSLEEAATAYEETIAGMYGTTDELQKAWDQQKKNDEFYVKDYERYYQISKLQRSITKDLEAAAKTGNKQNQGLKKLFNELNDARENGVELSSYDLDIFSKRYEYEKALMELEDARNNKSEVRLQRDANGNWGYVYTSGEDEDDLIAKQQAVDDKFYELQKATQERIASLSNDMMDEITGVGRRLQELRSSGASQETIDKYLEQEKKYLENYRKGLSKALEDAGMTEEEARLRYGNEGFDILDKFGETLLSQITGGNETLEDFFARVGLAMDGTNKNMEQAGQEYENNMKSINDWFNKSGEDLTTVIKGFASIINDNSDKNLIDSKDQIQNAKDTFKEILRVATDFESKFIKIYQPIINENERLVKDLLTALHALNREEYEGPDRSRNSNTKARNPVKQPASKKSSSGGSSSGGSSSGGSSSGGSSPGGSSPGGSSPGGSSPGGSSPGGSSPKPQLIPKAEEIPDGGDKKGIDTVISTSTKYQPLSKYTHQKIINKTMSSGKIIQEIKNENCSFYDYKEVGEFIVRKCRQCSNSHAVPKTVGGGGGNYMVRLASGGYTGEWGSEGRMAMLHEKELVLNKDDTKNFLDATNILRTIDLQTNMFSKGLGNIITPWINDISTQPLDQNVHIEASFPNVQDHNEIELAFDNLINKASQYANRKNMSSMTFQDMYTSKF